MKQRGDQVFHLSQTGRQDQRRRRTAFSLVCSLELKVAAYTPSLSLFASSCPPLQPSPAGKAPPAARRAAARRRSPRLPLRRSLSLRRRRPRIIIVAVSSAALRALPPLVWSPSQPCSQERSTCLTRSWTSPRSKPRREPPERQQGPAVAAAAARGGGGPPICPRC